MSFAPGTLEWLLEATLRGSASIIAIWAMRPLLRRWLGARATHLLWLVVVVQLLAPALPDAPFSLSRLRPTEAAPATAPSFADTQILVSIDEAAAERVASIEGSPVGLHTARPSIPLIFIAWAFGAFTFMALALVRSLRALRLVRRSREISDEPAVRAALGELPIAPSYLYIRETAELRSPAVCGLLRPTVLLPVQWWSQLAPDELRCVLLHEIGHIRRLDLAWKWAFLLARAVHWFNPLVWLAERSARVDQELACDEWVLTQRHAPDAVWYGEVLLKATALLRSARFTSPVHATMAESVAGLTKRIRHLQHVRSCGWLAPVCALAIVALVVAFIAPPRSRAQDQPGQDERMRSEATPALSPPSSERAPAAASDSGGSRERRLIEIEAKFVEISGSVPPVIANGVKPATPVPEAPSPLPADPIDALIFGDGTRQPPGTSSTSTFTAAQFSVLQRDLQQMKGGDILSAPRVTTKPGQRAVIEIIREFRYPTEFTPQDPTGYVWPSAFETRNTGVTLEVTPEITSDGRIELLLSPQVVEFLGFVNYRAGRGARRAESQDALGDLLEPGQKTAHVLNQPIFRTRKITTAVVMDPGQTVLIGGMGRSDMEEVNIGMTDRLDHPSRGAEGKTGVIPRSLYIFITARLLEASINEDEILHNAPSLPADGTGAAKASAGTSTPPAVVLPADPATLANGIPVDGKAGFIRSPYAPEKGYIDVRGFPPGTEARCPYSGRVFLVP